MKIVMTREECSHWFMGQPIDGPAYVALCRVQEALTRIINGERGWKRRHDNGGYVSMYADGSEE